jgi:hypothetical protein
MPIGMAKISRVTTVMRIQIAKNKS